MKRFVSGLFILWVLFVMLAWQTADHYGTAIQSYQSNSRSPMFTAFITMGSFLLTLKTAILQRLREGFDSDAYLKVYLHAFRNGDKSSYYVSLANMSNSLAGCVALAFISSALQMTVGFIPHPLAFAICVSVPAITATLLFTLWIEIHKAHKLWLAKIEEDRKVEIADQLTR